MKKKTSIYMVSDRSFKVWFDSILTEKGKDAFSQLKNKPFGSIQALIDALKGCNVPFKELTVDGLSLAELKEKLEKYTKVLNFKGVATDGYLVTDKETWESYIVPDTTGDDPLKKAVVDFLFDARKLDMYHLHFKVNTTVKDDDYFKKAYEYYQESLSLNTPSEVDAYFQGIEEFLRVINKHPQLHTLTGYHTVLGYETRQKALKNADLFPLIAQYVNNGMPIRKACKTVSEAHQKRGKAPTPETLKTEYYKWLNDCANEVKNHVQNGRSEQQALELISEKYQIPLDILSKKLSKIS